MPSTRWTARAALAAALILSTFVVAVGVSPTPAGAAAGDATAFGAATPNLAPRSDLVLGDDGNVWFANAGSRIGEVTPAGAITLHDITGITNVFSVATGGDGNIWFTYSAGTQAGYGRWNVTTDAQTLFGTGFNFTGSMVEVADGNIWMSYGNGARRVLTATGALDASTVSLGAFGDMILGPDDNLWISQNNTTRALLKINPTTGVITGSYPTPTGVHPEEMGVGPDGNIWVEYENINVYGMFRFELSDHSFDLFPFSGGDRGARAPMAGPDGNLWFVSEYDDGLVRMSTAGVVLNTYTPAAFDVTTNAGTRNLVVGSDGDLWVGSTNRMVRVDPGQAVDPACLPPAFTDVSTSHPFFADICWMDQEGISTGYQPGPTYKPSTNVTRSAMSAFMYRLAGSPTFPDPPTATFTDVPTTHTFFTEIEWMADEDITTGYPGNLYKPANNVTRGAMSAFMYRLADEPPFTPPPANATTFSDVSATHPFYPEIEWMADEDITTGTPGNPKPTYKPANNVSRAAMSAFMHRLQPLLDN